MPEQEAIPAPRVFSLDTAVTGEPTIFESEIRWRQTLPDGYAHGLELHDLLPTQAECLYAIVGGAARPRT